MATTYNNISNLYDKMGEYSKTRSYYEKALENQQKTLPPTPNHPDSGACYSNIAKVYMDMEEYSKALPYLEYALNSFQHSSSLNQLLIFKNCKREIVN